MEVSYRRDLNHNYMILENEKITGKEYPIRMMEQNHIPELLPLQLRKMDGKIFLYYEITSRQPLVQLYDTISMKSRDIERLLAGIRNGIEHAHQFLLSSEDFLFEPEFIYMNLGTGQVQLCCVPLLERKEKNSFLTLAEFILKKLDHGDRRAVDLGYELFARVSQENFSFQECVKELLKEKSACREEEEPEKEGLPASSFEELEAFDFEEDEEGGGAAEYRSRKNKNTESKNVKGKAVKIKNGKKKAEKSGVRDVLLRLLVILILMLLFGAIVYFGRLDLTQTGGLAFLFLAVLWITYSVIQGRKQEKKKYWLEEEDEQDADQWMEALLEDIYDKGAGEGRTGAGSKEGGWREDREGREYRRRTEDREPDGDRGWDEPGKQNDGRWRGKDRMKNKGSRWQEDEMEEECGETRCLTEAEYEPVLRLASLQRSQYPDLELEKEKAVIGKKKDQVDLFLKQDCISRIHARLERQADGYFLTDLNSMNGTFVNGERLRPNEKRQIRAGDRISFASLRYVAK